MPPRSPDYSRKLARVIALKDGKRLVTLQDAADVILDVFGSVNARGGHVDSTIAGLIAAAESGKRADTADTTDSVQRLLSVRHLL
jgi:hypothetical protein